MKWLVGGAQFARAPRVANTKVLGSIAAFMTRVTRSYNTYNGINIKNILFGGIYLLMLSNDSQQISSCCKIVPSIVVNSYHLCLPYQSY